MKLLDLLSPLFDQAEVSFLKEEKGKEIVTKIGDLEIDDETAQKISDNLIGLKAAYNNPKIKAQHVKQFLIGTEAKLEAKIKESGLDEATQLEIIGEQRFNDRVEKFLDAMHKKTLEPAKGVDGIQKKYSEAMAELEELKKSHIPKTELENVLGQWDTERQDSALFSQISQFNWSESFQPNFRLPVFKMALEQKLNAIGAKSVYDKETKSFKLVQKESPDLEYFDSKNKKVTFEELSKDIAFENKFLSTAPANGPLDPKGPLLPPSPQATKSVNPALKAMEDDLKMFNPQ